MANKQMNHEMDQLAAMFSQLGKAAAQLTADLSDAPNGKVADAHSHHKDVGTTWQQIGTLPISEAV
ncbi:hypothetical protein [Parapedobacter sp. 2B3]|uniref:hypothetical protein n=1 Tax=Parapedobacter sp. 2B3 TaxID=3342381 RepID=UPI0035B591DB